MDFQRIKIQHKLSRPFSSLSISPKRISLFKIFCTSETEEQDKHRSPVIVCDHCLYSFAGSCPKLDLSNGKITYNRSPTNARYPKWTRAYYKCDTGYNLTSLYGPRRRVCSSSGKWDRDWDSMLCVKGNE